MATIPTASMSLALGLVGLSQDSQTLTVPAGSFHWILSSVHLFLALSPVNSSYGDCVYIDLLDQLGPLGLTLGLLREGEQIQVRTDLYRLVSQVYNGHGWTYQRINGQNLGIGNRHVYIWIGCRGELGGTIAAVKEGVVCLYLAW